MFSFDSASNCKFDVKLLFIFLYFPCVCTLFYKRFLLIKSIQFEIIFAGLLISPSAITYVWCTYNYTRKRLSVPTTGALKRRLHSRVFQSVTRWALISSSLLWRDSAFTACVFGSCDHFCGLRMVCWWAAEGENLVPCWKMYKCSACGERGYAVDCCESYCGFSQTLSTK